MADYENILVERRDTVTLVTLNRPQTLNALNTAVLEDLIAAFTAFEADDRQRCAVLTGSGEKAFAAGADIKEMADKPMADFYREDFFARWTSDFTNKIRKPWIAAVNGFALGGGCELAMMADFIIAADSAKFGQPEIKLGVSPGMGGSQRPCDASSWTSTLRAWRVAAGSSLPAMESAPVSVVWPMGRQSPCTPTRLVWA